jgi:hypothetical protein
MGGAAPLMDHDRASASVLLAKLERCRHPAGVEISELCSDPMLFALLGLSARALALCKKWTAAGIRRPELERAETLLTSLTSTASGAARLRARGSKALEAAVVNSSMRGQLDRTIDLAASANWFLDNAEASNGLYHALAALVVFDRCQEALALVREWHVRHPDAEPMHMQRVLQIEARIASNLCLFARERTLLEECLVLCKELAMASHTFLAEADLAAALLHAGDVERARAMIRAWPRQSKRCDTPLDAFRELVRAELALLSGASDDAFAAATRALGPFEAVGHGPLICHLHFYRALSAREGAWPIVLDEFRGASAGRRFPQYLARLRILERLTSAATPARCATVIERSRSGEARLPLIRIWIPRITSLGADLYLDRIQQRIYVRGDGPMSLSGRPVISRALDCLISEAARPLPIAEWFERVWGTQYEPLRHEGKLHVTVHRLRRWLTDAARGAEGLVVLCEGMISLAPEVDVRVIGVARDGRAESLRDRIAEILHVEPQPPAALQSLVNVSRSTLRNVLRELIEAGVVQKKGRGATTKYALRRN